MKLTVIGAGAWGTALALSAAQRHEVTLWCRDPAQADRMRQERQNARYLPGLAFPAALRVATGAASALDRQSHESELVVIATPMAGVREVLSSLRELTVPVAWLCKGFEPAQPGQPGLMVHEIAAAVAPALACGVLSGPSFAQEVARGQPTALVASSAHAPVQAALVQAFHAGHLRVYVNSDVIGVEVGGAVKNVLAIATGLCDGLQLGLNARAALITRGLAEMTRLGLALGARPDTFMGLSGLGDLVLTATGDLSRNRKVGLLLAQGLSLAQAVQSLGHVAEGVYCARTVIQRAEALGVNMPIASAVGALLDGRLSAAAAVQALMGRDATSETPSG